MKKTPEHVISEIKQALDASKTITCWVSYPGPDVLVVDDVRETLEWYLTVVFNYLSDPSGSNTFELLYTEDPRLNNIFPKVVIDFLIQGHYGNEINSIEALAGIETRMLTPEEDEKWVEGLVSTIRRFVKRKRYIQNNPMPSEIQSDQN